MQTDALEAATILSRATRAYHDFECLENFMCDTVKDYHTGFSYTFKVGLGWDDREALIYLYNTLSENRAEVISFNGVHYDSPIANATRLRFFDVQDAEEFCFQLKRFSDTIIHSEIWWRVEEFKPLKYDHRWIDLDLFLYWSKQLRLQKRISLKSIGVQLGYPVVQEIPVDHSKPVTLEDIPAIVIYNGTHDIGILEYMMRATFNWQGKPSSFETMIQMRREAMESEGFFPSVMHYDDVKLGLAITLRHYCRKRGIVYRDLPKPFGFNGIVLKHIISGKVSFREGSSFDLMFRDLQRRFVSSTKEIEYVLKMGGITYDVKSGGLHSRNRAELVEPDPDKYIYLDVDVASYYPSLVEVLDTSPRHLPGFSVTLKEMKERRIHLKRMGLGKTPEANRLKLGMNGTIGNLNQYHSAIRDPVQFLKVTVNGQLFLLMLAEWVTSAGANIDMANTDGLTLIIPRDRYEAVIQQCKTWEHLTGMELEYVRYRRMWRLNVNSYLAQAVDGSVKEKGFFVTEPDLGNRVDFLVIPRAVQRRLVNEIEPVDYLHDSSRHIYEFCGAQKVDKTYKVVWGEEELPQRLNRYYVSLQGKALYKQRRGKKAAMPGLKGHPVLIYNEYEDKPLHSYGLNMKFYTESVETVLAEMGLGRGGQVMINFK